VPQGKLAASATRYVIPTRSCRSHGDRRAPAIMANVRSHPKLECQPVSHLRIPPRTPCRLERQSCCSAGSNSTLVDNVARHAEEEDGPGRRPARLQGQCRRPSCGSAQVWRAVAGRARLYVGVDVLVRRVGVSCRFFLLPHFGLTSVQYQRLAVHRRAIEAH
jgi:hypothetical protein